MRDRRIEEALAAWREVERQLQNASNAKGVESREQAWRLAELGCRYGQRFFLSEAVGRQRRPRRVTAGNAARLVNVRA